MKFSEKLRRARSHILVVVVMIATAIVVVTIEDDDLGNEDDASRLDATDPLR